MADLPSFRPRALLGLADERGRVTPSAEFLRWLDDLARATDTTAAAVSSESATFASYIAATEASTPAAPASYATQADDAPLADYTTTDTDAPPAVYSEAPHCIDLTEYPA
jgi:hypothetical protein